jgi:hypothetical protein
MANRIVLYEIELGQLLVATAILWALQWFEPMALRRAWRAVRRFAERRRSCVALTGLVGFGASAALTAGLGMPTPRIHDEFSYLLAADTFAHGRLSNPQHPCWQFFEAVHVNQQPTYHSKYPPAQGLVLAAGKVLTGHDIVGVWLSMGLACAAVCWMVQAWCPPRWALVGGLLMAFRFVFMRHPWTRPLEIGYWSQSYWGGAVAAIGGALVFGAVRRLVQRARAWDAALLGLGLAVLTSSRPFEGFVAALPVAALTVWALVRHGRHNWRRICAIVVPLAIVLAAAFTWLGYYNLRTTGSIFVRAGPLNSRLYGSPPICLLDTIGPERKYRHENHRQYYAHWARSAFLSQQTLRGYFERTKQVAVTTWSFYFGLLLSVPMIALPWAVGNGWSRLALFTCGLLLFALAFVPWFQVHYLSPIAPLFVYFEVRCLRVFWLSRRRGRSFWRALAAAVPLSLIIVMPTSAAVWCESDQHEEWFDQRQQLLVRLKNHDGKHLVLVSGNASPFEEWAYNGADFNGPIVWAHDMGAAENAELLKYYQNRKVWLVEADRRPVQMKPYEGPPGFLKVRQETKTPAQ